MINDHTNNARVFISLSRSPALLFVPSAIWEIQLHKGIYWYVMFNALQNTAAAREATAERIAPALALSRYGAAYNKNGRNSLFPCGLCKSICQRANWKRKQHSSGCFCTFPNSQLARAGWMICGVKIRLATLFTFWSCAFSLSKTERRLAGCWPTAW